MTNGQLSEEIVNAFVDGELDASERIHILNLSEESEEVRTRICETRTLKDLVRSAYEEIPAPHANRRLSRQNSGGWIRTAVASLFFLACGLLMGHHLWPTHTLNSVAQQDPVFLDVDQLNSLQEAITARGAVANLILHVESNDIDRLESALAKIEDYVTKQSTGPLRTHIEVVANGRGLDLLRVGGTPFEDRVRNLTDSDTLTLLACQRALGQLRSAGVEIDLIPEADYASSALDWIIKRLQEGWVYVKV